MPELISAMLWFYNEFQFLAEVHPLINDVNPLNYSYFFIIQKYMHKLIIYIFHL